MTYQPQHRALVVTVDDGHGQVFQSAVIATSNAAHLWSMLTSNATDVDLQDNKHAVVVKGVIEVRLVRRVTAEDRMQQVDKQVQQLDQQTHQVQQQVDELLGMIESMQRQQRVHD
jgi:peptidoglycan hydrolase CwlO-like protein